MEKGKAPDARVEMFRNRLRKNLARLLPWARQRGIEALRLYDRDIPEVRLIVEKYREADREPAREHIVLWEYARRVQSADEEAQGADPEMPADDRFLDEVIAVICDLCGVPAERVHVKRRERQRGSAQYQRLQRGEHELVVREGGHRFLLNLTDFLDTGLFLDHRETRALVQRVAAGKRVLNLFAYTGSFTVYAAAGGALRSVTMDMSSTYLDWAGRNFAQNRLDPRRHVRVRADVLGYLRAPLSVPEARGPFDLIVMDPPTFSNSKRMDGTLDVLRDHPWLIERALALLAPGGALLFSTNHTGFKLRAEEMPGARFRDLSADTLSRDFREARARRCYWITRADDALAALAPPR
jgi:23S rRNA (cytosine1962-C5)-methyltransferase